MKQGRSTVRFHVIRNWKSLSSMGRVSGVFAMFSVEKSSRRNVPKSESTEIGLPDTHEMMPLVVQPESRRFHPPFRCRK